MTKPTRMCVVRNNISMVLKVLHLSLERQFILYCHNAKAHRITTQDVFNVKHSLISVTAPSYAESVDVFVVFDL
jgi:hypothetical protein